MTATQQNNLEADIVTVLTLLPDEESVFVQSPVEATTTPPETTAPETNPPETTPPETTPPPKTEKDYAIEAANDYKNQNPDVILTTYGLYEHLCDLGFSADVCEEVCFIENSAGFYDGAAMYDYERIMMFYNQGYSRDAIIDFYTGTFSYEEAEELVDQCLAGRKLSYQRDGDTLTLIEYE